MDRGKEKLPEQQVTIHRSDDGKETVVISPVNPDYPAPGPQAVITDFDEKGDQTGGPRETNLEDLDW